MCNYFKEEAKNSILIHSAAKWQEYISEHVAFDFDNIHIYKPVA
jgi:hypothetical protein